MVGWASQSRLDHGKPSCLGDIDLGDTGRLHMLLQLLERLILLQLLFLQSKNLFPAGLERQPPS